MSYPKRLIEVDLPIKRISAHARREKSIRHGHISTLHIWWARRPLAACRAVICAALWPDPGDELCPQRFRDDALRIMAELRERVLGGRLSDDQRAAKEPVERIHVPEKPSDYVGLRRALLDFIAEFANWDLSTNRFFLDASRALTQSAHEALGGAPGTRPLVVDPFAGGGSIPLEALRVGADAFASDLNPVAVLLNKVVLEYVPRYGQRLADEVRKWGHWIKEQTSKELAELYPKDASGGTPIAYLWARTITCEGPSCGAEVPLMRSLWLAKKGKRSVALKLVPKPEQKAVEFLVLHDAKAKDVGDGTVRRGSAICPCCGYTTPVASVRTQLGNRHGGAADARMFAVVVEPPNQERRTYRLPSESDLRAVDRARQALKQCITLNTNVLPNEHLPPQGTLGYRVQGYGVQQWVDMFTPRQIVTLSTLARHCRQLAVDAKSEEAVALSALLSCALSRTQDLNASTTTWANTIEAACGANRAQNRMPMVWDFVEVNPLADAGGNWVAQTEWVARVVEHVVASKTPTGQTIQSPAQQQTLPDDSAHAFVSDPPYYDAFGYSDLSDFFAAWLKRSLPTQITAAWTVDSAGLTPKNLEIVVNPGAESDGRGKKDRAWFEQQMTLALADSRRVLMPSGIGVVVFANKSTSGWESLLEAMVGAGWVITGSWPIDTERPNRQRAQDSAALTSSVHLVCRPRETRDGSLLSGHVGDWRDVLAELPKRIHAWLPRLAAEGVVGADAIFACLGPALEVFSRFSRVEKASGEQVTLGEYLEQVWAAVSKEALNMIFAGGDATGFEEDARLTAMWLWTLSTNRKELTAEGAEERGGEEDESEDGEDEAEGRDSPRTSASSAVKSGFSLEYDAARKIAQGLGAHLEKLTGVVEVKGDTARLLSVSERTSALFGKEQAEAPAGRRKKKDKQMQLGFVAELEAAEAESGGWGEKSVSKAGDTVLDRVHQSMILFAAGRGEALRRFLVEDGVGRDQRFWRLAQALSALYPSGTDEKRWVDGVLARKKGLGL